MTENAYNSLCLIDRAIVQTDMTDLCEQGGDEVIAVSTKRLPKQSITTTSSPPL